jgi:hypothetical protein
MCYTVHVSHRYGVRTKKERVTYSQRSEEKMKRSNIKNQQTGERKRDKNEQNRKQRKQATKGMKAQHENERKYWKGKWEVRNTGMTRKSRKRETVEKNTEEEEMRIKKYLYMPCQANPLTRKQ